MLLVILTERFICLACEICLSKTNISYISDRVERIVGSTSNSSELNDSGDQAADSQQQEAEETTPESSTSRYGHKRTRVLRESYVPWHNIHVQMQPSTYNKTPN